MNTSRMIPALVLALTLQACGGGTEEAPGDVWHIPTAGAPVRTACSASFTNAAAAPVTVTVAASAQRTLTTPAGRLGAQTFVAYLLSGAVFSTTAGASVQDGATTGRPLTWSDNVRFTVSVPAGARLDADLVAAILGAVPDGATLTTAGCSVIVTP